jgi:hypothetical protein
MGVLCGVVVIGMIYDSGDGCEWLMRSSGWKLISRSVDWSSMNFSPLSCKCLTEPLTIELTWRKKEKEKGSRAHGKKETGTHTSMGGSPSLLT